MKKSIDLRYINIILMLLFVVPAKAQHLNQNREETCHGPVFSALELSRRATITSRPIPAMTQEALANDVHGRVVLEAVLCRTGRVTDLRVIKSLPYGITEKSLEAVRQIRFSPAEMNWHTVSQKMRFEFHFNESGVEIDAEDAEGRTVEAIEVLGNRRLKANEIMSLIQTRPGDLCSVQQMKKDLARILATGYFNSRGTRVETEKRLSGGIVVVIEVQELPLISQVKIEGLKGIPESVLFEALLHEDIDIRPGRVYDMAKVKTAISVVGKILASHGQPDAVIEERTEFLTATSVVLVLVIRAKQ
ncbi:MAG: TonB family protein [Pyrinomonadaceae bacterium]